MKIAIVYFGHFESADDMSAAARRIRDIGRGLVAQGHEVAILLPRRRADEAPFEMDGIRVRYLGKAGGGWLLGRLRYWPALLRLAREEGLDWVIYYYLRGDAVPVSRRLARMGTKTAAVFADKHSANYGWRDVTRWPLWLYIKLGEDLLPRAGHLNVCISRRLAAHCEAQAPGVPRMLLPVLVDSDRFVPSAAAAERAGRSFGIPDDAVVVSYLGGLWRHHGVGTLIRAFAAIADRHPQARLLVAGRPGPGETHDDVAALVARHGLEDRAIAPGWVDTQAVIDLSARTDIFALPQLDTEATNTGLPTKIAEYAQMGRAIVATDTSDIAVYFRDGSDALIVPPGDVDALADALDRLLGDPSLRAALGAAAREVAASHFDYREAGRALAGRLAAP